MNELADVIAVIQTEVEATLVDDRDVAVDLDRFVVDLSVEPVREDGVDAPEIVLRQDGRQATGDGAEGLLGRPRQVPVERHGDPDLGETGRRHSPEEDDGVHLGREIVLGVSLGRRVRLLHSSHFHVERGLQQHLQRLDVRFRDARFDRRLVPDPLGQCGLLVSLESEQLLDGLCDRRVLWHGHDEILQHSELDLAPDGDPTVAQGAVSDVCGSRISKVGVLTNETSVGVVHEVVANPDGVGLVVVLGDLDIAVTVRLMGGAGTFWAGAAAWALD